MSGDGDPPDGGEEQRKVEDAGEVNKRQRLLAIHKQWAAAMDRATAAKDAMREGATEQACHQYYRVGVENLLTELYSLGEEAEPTSVWNTAELGNVVIDVPPSIDSELKTSSGRLLSPAPKPKIHQVVGLRGFLNTDWPISAAFELIHGPPRDPRRITEAVEREPPLGMSDRAMQAARRFMTDNGIDFERGFPEKDMEAEPF